MTIFERVGLQKSKNLSEQERELADFQRRIVAIKGLGAKNESINNILTKKTPPKRLKIFQQWKFGSRQINW